MKYIIYFLPIFITCILLVIIKDNKKAIKISGILSILSGVFILTISLIFNLIITNYINMINLFQVKSFILNKFYYNSIILLTIGIIELLISKYIIKPNKKMT